MKENEKTELFETMPIRCAAMTLVIPTVISQLVMLVYNMADTWYIGQTGDPYQVAAVTVTYPIFMLMNVGTNEILILTARRRQKKKSRRTADISVRPF